MLLNINCGDKESQSLSYPIRTYPHTFTIIGDYHESATIRIYKSGMDKKPSKRIAKKCGI